MPTTLTDQILAVQRMARCSRYWARAARATAAEFEPELAEIRRKIVADSPVDKRVSEAFIDIRTVTLDKDDEAQNHDRDAEALEAVVRRLEEMQTVLSGFAIMPPDGDGDVWLRIEDQGDGRQAAFNLGKSINAVQPESSHARTKIGHHVAALLEAARQSALEPKS